MSRKNAKLAKITDLQGHQPAIILTKKDCDTIADSLFQSNKNNLNPVIGLYWYFKNLSMIRKGNNTGKELRPYCK